MKKILIFVAIWLVLIISACGSSIPNTDLSCVEECGMMFSRENINCRTTHGMASKDGIECSKLALQKNHNCSAQCNGDL
jgi:hypothetical protein